MSTDSKLVTNRVYREMIVVCLGDIEDGFEFYGPFHDTFSARAWVKDNVDPKETAKQITVNDVRDGEDDE